MLGRNMYVFGKWRMISDINFMFFSYVKNINKYFKISRILFACWSESKVEI